VDGDAATRVSDDDVAGVDSDRAVVLDGDPAAGLSLVHMHVLR
jgi:hypothetical protein